MESYWSRTGSQSNVTGVPLREEKAMWRFRDTRERMAPGWAEAHCGGMYLQAVNATDGCKLPGARKMQAMIFL